MNYPTNFNETRQAYITVNATWMLKVKDQGHTRPEGDIILDPRGRIYLHCVSKKSSPLGLS